MARYNTPKGKVWEKKNPGDFTINMHDAILDATIGVTSLLVITRTLEEAERQARLFLQFRKLVYDFPLHPTTRKLLARPKQSWRSEIVALTPVCYEVRVRGVNDLKDFTEFFLRP